MIKLLRPVAALASVVALVIAGVAVASAASSGGNAPSADKTNPRGVPTNAVLTWSATAVTVSTSTNLEFVGLATGCRIFDTRNAGGPFAVSAFRDLSVLDTAVAGQGGASGGCGIPTAAIAVDLSLSTAGGSPTNVGYVRVGPGGVTPTATVLQFLKGQGTSVTTTAALSTSDTMRLQVFGASTHLIGDVLGYWQATAQGTIDSDGTLLEGSGVSSVFKSPNNAGDYYVTFDRSVAGCTAVATPGEVPLNTRVIVSMPPADGAVLFDIRDLTTSADSDGQLTFVLQC